MTIQSNRWRKTQIMPTNPAAAVRRRTPVRRGWIEPTTVRPQGSALSASAEAVSFHHEPRAPSNATAKFVNSAPQA